MVFCLVYYNLMVKKKVLYLELLKLRLRDFISKITQTPHCVSRVLHAINSITVVRTKLALKIQVRVFLVTWLLQKTECFYLLILNRNERNAHDYTQYVAFHRSWPLLG